MASPLPAGDAWPTRFLGGLGVRLEVRVELDAGLRQGIAEATEALGHGVDAHRLRQHRDATVPVRDEVLGGSPRTAVVVERDGVGREVALRSVEEDDGGAQLHLARKIAVVAPDGHDEQAAEALRHQRVDDAVLALGLEVGAGE